MDAHAARGDAAAMPDLAAIVSRATAIRHDLHRHPELTWQERRTAAVVRAELAHLGIAWSACAEHGTVARLAPGRGGRHVAIRADLDALPLAEATGCAHASTVPGAMHACGHDGHTACLLGAAAWLKAHEERLPGPVTLLFQPAEEGGHGARRMVAEGCLDGVDAVFAFHNWSGLPAGSWACPDGPVMAAKVPRVIKLPPGDYYYAVEAARGRFAVRVVSDGKDIPYRVKLRTPSFANLTLFEEASAGMMLPDALALMGSLDLVIPDIDR